MTQGMTFAKYINYRVNEYVKTLKRGVFFGQNVISGSRVSGLGAKLEEHQNILSLNTPNSENTLFGLGFGLSMQQIPSIYLMKQHDFALLAMDHMVNTKRLMQNTTELAPFLVIMVVVESGFEGPQSNLNNLDDYFSLSNSKVWLLNSKEAIDSAFLSDRQNFEIFAIAQSTLKLPIYPNDSVLIEGGFAFEKNSSIVENSNPVLLNCGLVTNGFRNCENFLKSKGIDFQSAIQVEMNLEANVDFISRLAKKERKFVIFDASKSRNKLSNEIAFLLSKRGSDVYRVNRSDFAKWKYANDDQIAVDHRSILEFIKES